MSTINVTPEAAPALNTQGAQLMMAGFAPSLAIGVTIVNFCTDALYQIFRRADVDLNTLWCVLLFCVLFGVLVFLLDKVSIKLRILFFIFNVMTLVYFCVSTNNSMKMQESAKLDCKFNFICFSRN